MNLAKFRVFVVGAVLTCLVGLAVMLASVVLDGYERLDGGFMRDNAQRVQRAFDERMNFLSVKVSDWAAWDEAYKYVTFRDQNFATANFTDTAIGALKISFVGFLDKESELIAAYQFMDEAQKLTRLNGTDLPFMEIGSKVLADSMSGVYTGLVSFKGGVALLATRPVTKGDGSGPAAGRVFFGQIIDKPFLESLSTQTLTTVGLKSEDAEETNGGHGASIDLPIGRIVLGPEVGTFYMALKSASGGDLGTLAAEIRRAVYLHGKNSAEATLVVFAIMGLFLVFGVISFLSSAKVRRGFDQLVLTNERTKESEAHLKALLESIPGYVSWFDYSLKYLGVNKRLADDNHMTQEEFVGKECGFLSQRSDPNMRHLLSELFASSNPFHQTEILLHDKSKTRKFVLCLQKYDGLKKVVVVGIDMTAAWKMELQSIRDRQMAMQASRLSALGEMAGGIAHEINNPLMVVQGIGFKLSRVMQGHADFAKSDDFAKGRELLKALDGTVLRIGKIVSGLKSIARDGSNDPLASADIKLIIDETLAICEDKFKGGEVALSMHCAHSNLQAHCRSVQVGQVLINLLNNAYDAVQGIEEPWVRVTVNDSDDQVIIFIEDSGTGIPADVVDKMMTPFFTTKGVGVGTGLGLSIAKGIMIDHGGDLIYDKTSPHTRFVVTLPKRATQKDTLAA